LKLAALRGFEFVEDGLETAGLGEVREGKLAYFLMHLRGCVVSRLLDA
jgi:hypothetical protein